MDAKKAGTKSNRSLLWILIVLGVVIVGLVVGILVVHFTQGEPSDDTYPQSMHTPELEEINELARTLPESEARQLYLDAINVASNRQARSEARVEYGRYLYDMGYPGEMFEQFTQVEEDYLDAGYKMLLYSAYRTYYEALGEKAISDSYNEMIREVVENSNYAAGG